MSSTQYQIPFPPGFPELPLPSKIYYARKALSNDTYLDNIIRWLKDSEREHNQTEDEAIVLVLNTKADRLAAEGILLPPPFALEYFSYLRDYMNYLKKYAEFPNRQATEKEKKTILYYKIGHSLHVDIVINDLLNGNLLPTMEYNNHPNNILNNLENLEEDTARRLLQYTYDRGDYKDIGMRRQLIDLFTQKIQYWQEYKNELRKDHPRENLNLAEFSFNKGIKNYTIARDFIQQVFIDESRKIYKAIETAEPGSLLHRLPMNLAPTITEFATGLKHSQYQGGKRSRRQKRTKRKQTKRK